MSILGSQTDSMRERETCTHTQRENGRETDRQTNLERVPEMVKREIGR